MLLLTQHFPPEGGAHAGRWAWLAQGLVDHGHELHVIVPRWRHRHSGEPWIEGVVVHEVMALVPGLGLRSRITNELLTAGQSLIRAMSIPAPDVVIATVPSLPALPTGSVSYTHLTLPTTPYV